MSDKLTSRRADSLESKFSTPSDSATDDEAEKGDFLAGVRKGIRRLGSISGGRQRPTNIQTGERATTASPELPSAGRESPRSPRKFKHARSTSNLNREKPLPETPVSPPIEQLLQRPFSPPDTPKPFASMSRPAVSGSRTSTMDSTTSGPPLQMYATGPPQASSVYVADISTSQSSIASS